MSRPAPRTLIACKRKNISETVVLEDELPPLQEGGIRLRVDKVGLSANNLFYAQMGEAPFLKFFAVYPLGKDQPELAIVPAWGLATVIESNNPDFRVGERFRGFLHMTNVVQMSARRTPGGFTAHGGNRDKINPAYNDFLAVNDGAGSPFAGEGPKPDLAMTAAPGGLSGFILAELLAMNDFYGGNAVALTSASSKLSLATALELRTAREQGILAALVAYTARNNRAFVERTGLYDYVLAYDEPLPGDADLQPVFIDVAGDAEVYRRDKTRWAKALAVGGTHGDAKSSTFTAFGPSGFLKMFIDMVAPKRLQDWATRRLHPPLEMFFAPSVVNTLLDRWGREELDRRSDEALTRLVDAAIDDGWISVDRSEDAEGARAAWGRIVAGTVAPSEAIILSLPDPH